MASIVGSTLARGCCSKPLASAPLRGLRNAPLVRAGRSASTKPREVFGAAPAAKKPTEDKIDVASVFGKLKELKKAE